MLHTLLSARPELAIFAALIVGYAVGAIKPGRLNSAASQGPFLQHW